MQPDDPITQYQIKVIHVGKRALGLSEDDYRAIISGASGGATTSSKDLDQKGVQVVMETYLQMGFEPAGGYNKRRANGRTRHVRPRRNDPKAPITGPMQQKIIHLYADLDWGMDRQQQFNRRQCNKPWPQTRQDAIKIIEGLKAILGRRKSEAK